MDRETLKTQKHPETLPGWHRNSYIEADESGHSALSAELIIGRALVRIQHPGS